MQLKHVFYAVVITAITVLACQKEVSLTDIPNPAINATVTATVVGRIVDENGAPVQGALAKAGTSTAQTNINGEFRINGATLSDKAAFVSAEKSGFFTGSRTFIPRAGQKHYVEIQLLPKTLSGSVDAAIGGTISLANGSAVTLPANGVVVKSTGLAYTGTIQVAIAWIDPTSVNLMRQMPGDLRGVSENNAAVGLQSFGMLAVELNSPGGEALQVMSGKKASLKFPLPTAISSIAPATIALWSFSDSTGLWKQEGMATKSGNFYTAEVGHFSFWNCDAPFPTVNFSTKFVNQNGQPLQHVLVKIKRPALINSWAGTGWTDSAGNVSGLVPANEALVLEVYPSYNCSQSLFTQNIGPFSTGTNLGNITVTILAASNFSVTGSVVDCNSAVVSAGYINVNAGSSYYRAPIVNGSFSLAFPGCSTSQTVTYYAVDSINNVQSTPVTATLTTGTNALGTITACGLSSQRFINFTLDGVAYTITSPPDSTTGFYNQTRTLVTGLKSNTANSSTSFNTAFSGNTTGTFPLSYLNINTPTFNDSTSIPSAGINVTITEYGTLGTFIGGNFSGTLNGANNATHTIQCTFRVRRD